MSTTIRLARGGRKKLPFYSIVVTNSRSPRDSNFLEKIGTYNPLLKDDADKRVVINAERAKYWLSVGAQPSDRVHRFLHKAGLIEAAPRMRAERKPRKEAKAEA
ncbi:MAG: 30S ribosomal protein S16 [Alphaproteobacteria bacterium]|nr:30S ribosomal protein S16 [Alphaproteobacteria bacterium]